MKNVTVNGTLVPEIYIASNRNRQKIYKSKENKAVDNKIMQVNEVFLNDGSNFEIELYNNQTENVGFEIIINGQLISNSLIILKPAQRYFLDRFIDTNNKFLFETYKVNNTQQNKDITKNNGRITVRCYKEQYINRYNTWIGTTTYYPYTYPFYNYPVYTQGSINIGGIFSNGTVTLDGGVNTTTVSNGSCTSSTYTVTNCSSGVFDTNSTYTSSCDLNGTLDNSKTFETGKVEKGSESNQSFSTTSFNRAFSHFHEIEYFISPMSMFKGNPENFKIHCIECGYRLRKQTFKFCPNCGTKQ